MAEIGFSQVHNLPWIDDGIGERRILGRVPPKRKYGFPAFKERYPVIDRSKWNDWSLRWTGSPILDQDGHGSCVGHGAVTVFDIAWRASGATHQPFSACCIYGQINGGSDNGAMVGDAAEALAEVGVCLLDQVPPNMVYQRQFPAGWKEVAARFRIEKPLGLSTFDEIGSAVQSGFAVCFGCQIGSAFDPDSSGVIPNQRGGGGGHCMAVIGVKNIGGKWLFEVQNSWSARWGANGFCYMPESYFGGADDSWGVLIHREDPNDPVEPVRSSARRR